jgi:hypothetical protein
MRKSSGHSLQFAATAWFPLGTWNRAIDSTNCGRNLALALYEPPDGTCNTKHAPATYRLNDMNTKFDLMEQLKAISMDLSRRFRRNNRSFEIMVRLLKELQDRLAARACLERQIW